MKHLYGNIRTGKVYVGTKELNGKRMDLIRKGELLKLAQQNYTFAVLTKKEATDYIFEVIIKKDWGKIEDLLKQGWQIAKDFD